MRGFSGTSIAVALLVTAAPTHAIDVADPDPFAAPDSGEVAPPAGGATDSTATAPAAAPAAPDTDHVAWPEAAETPREPGPVHRAVRSVRDVASDGLFVLSSPARLRGKGLATLGVVLATGGLLYVYDEDILRAVQRNDGAGGAEQFVDVGEFVEPVGIMERTMRYYAFAFTAATIIDFDGLQAVSGEIIESHLIGAGLRVVFRPLVGRARPVDSRGSQDYRIGEGRSFPSGHTSVFFELATIVSHHAHAWPVTVAAYSLATAGAIQRIDAGGHWPSDVFLSAVSGTLIARTVIRRSEARKSELEPYGTWVRGGPRLGVRVRY